MFTIYVVYRDESGITHTGTRIGTMTEVTAYLRGFITSVVLSANINNI